jgi:hypothetical protein
MIIAEWKAALAQDRKLNEFQKAVGMTIADRLETLGMTSIVLGSKYLASQLPVDAALDHLVDTGWLAKSKDGGALMLCSGNMKP